MRYDFTGAFAPYIFGLIAQKRAFGFDYLESERILYMFERFCQEQFPNETQITQQLVLKWAECRDFERNLFRLNRVSVIRELARYMNGIGIAAYVLPMELMRKTERHIPHIYTKEELYTIFGVIDQCQPSTRTPAKHLVVSVMFRMIYCCGLRPIEARRLRPEDVDLNTGCVKILESKGHKDRIVMLSGSILELCRRYSKKVGLIYPERRFFFPSPSSRGEGMYSQEWIIPTFRKFLIEAGLYHHCAGNEPRLYDLRHTFATHRLYQWMKEGQDVNACLAYLSEYMGHKNLSDTAYYIHLVPEFFPQMSDLHLEDYVDMIPEVEQC